MFKRQESFRYIFPQPISGFLTIIKNKDHSTESNKGEINIHNISPKGCSFSSHLHFPHNNEFTVTIEVCLNDTPLYLTGSIVWKKNSGKHYLYGFETLDNPVTAKLITDEVKSYVTKNRI